MTIFSYFKKHAFIVSVLVLLIVIIAVIAGRVATQKPAVATNNGPKKVTLVSAASFRSDSRTVAADGVIESKAQADLKSQTSAPLSAIEVSIGSVVHPGQVILELQNADIKAQLDQAKSALAVAQGQQYTGSVSLSSAKQNTIDKIQDAYVKAYDIVNAQIDPILYNNDSNGGRLTSYITDSNLSNEITSIDIDFKSGFRDWKTASDALSASSTADSIEATVRLSQNYLNQINKLLGDMSQALNDSARYANGTFAASVSGWKAVVTGALSTISGLTAALTGAESALTAASASQGSTAPAQVSAAQAGVNNLEAQLAKTIITSPIAGKVAALPLKVGELASPGTLLATVVGSGGLRVKAFASGDDIAHLKVGLPATIQGNIKGVVSNIAPSVNTANRKVEVDVDVMDSDSSGLVVGQTVSVSIINQSDAQTQSQSSQPSGKATVYVLPIQDVKIIPGNAYVYTVDANSKIKRNEVILDQVRGDFIEVTSGLTDDMNIVTPVYELDEGQVVSVQ